jgi:hypothetical protein
MRPVDEEPSSYLVTIFTGSRQVFPSKGITCLLRSAHNFNVRQASALAKAWMALFTKETTFAARQPSALAEVWLALFTKETTFAALYC